MTQVLVFGTGVIVGFVIGMVLMSVLYTARDDEFNMEDHING